MVCTAHRLQCKTPHFTQHTFPMGGGGGGGGGEGGHVMFKMYLNQLQVI